MPQTRKDRVDRLAERLAVVESGAKTEAVRVALENELARVEGAKTLAERLQPIRERIAKRPPTGLDADKAFYDELSGDL
jgi:antitoxin VapB